jgi:hypothetical protein
VVFPLAMGAGGAVRALAFQLAVGAGVALHTAVFHLAMRAGGAHHTVPFQLPMRAPTAHQAVPFPLPVGTKHLLSLFCERGSIALVSEKPFISFFHHHNPLQEVQSKA